jgi:integrase
MELRRMTYTVKVEDGKTRREKSDKWYAVFVDFTGQIRRIPLDADKGTARELAGKIDKLNKTRGSGGVLTPELADFIKIMPPPLRDRLVKYNIVESVKVYANLPLVRPLKDGKPDEKAEPGIVDLWEAGKRAKGNDELSITPVVARVKRIIAECGFVTWTDLHAPGAAGKIATWVGGLRERKEISGTTANKFIGDIKDLCNWIKEQGFADIVALASLKRIENADADSDRRRALGVEEMPWLVQAAASGAVRYGLAGDERAILYRFAFETGIRPGQIRHLTVANFHLADDPAFVKTQAKFVKRRREHVQVIKPGLAEELRRRFESKMPGAPAFKMPGKYRLADMLRDDLAIARQMWIDEGNTDQDKIERGKSDFLADVNHDGERTVFYSTRHGHGTALGNAGVPEKDIAASMHHTNRSTTQRYLHSDRQRVSKAVEQLPDLGFTINIAAATGTDGKGLPVNLLPHHDLPRPDAPRSAPSTETVEDSPPLSNMRENAEPSDGSSSSGQIAQLVEQWTENPCVAGSIPALPNNHFRPDFPVFS